MAYLQTGSSFSPAQAQSKINQARQVEMSTGRAMLETLTQTTDIMQSHAAQEFNKEMELQQEISIQKAITDANIAVKPEQYVADIREGDNAYNIAWNKQQRANVATNVGTLIQSETTKLAEQHKYDPEAFKGAMTGLYESLQEEYNFQGETQGLIQQALMSETERYIGSISANGYARLKQETFAKEMELFDSSMNVAMNSYRTTGDVNRWNEDLEVMEVQIQNMLDNGDIDPSQALKMKQSIRTEGESQLLQGNIDRSLESGDLAAATRYMDAWEDNARKSGIMTPDEIDAELNRSTAAIKARKKAIDDSYSAVTKLTAGIPLDYKNKKDQKAVDAGLKSVLGDAPDFNDPMVRQTATQFAMTYGIVPSQLDSYIRASQFSQDPEVVNAGVTSMQSLLKAHPQLADQFSSKDLAFADSVVGYTDSGMNLEQAIDAARLTQTKTFKEKQDYVKATEFESNSDFIKKSASYANDYADDKVSAWFEFGEEINAQTMASVRSDYQRIFEYNLGRTGNVDGAKQATERDLNRKYGITYVNGKRELTAYPVEQMTLNITADQMTEDNPVTKQWNDTKLELQKQRTDSTWSAEKGSPVEFTLMPSTLTSQGAPIFQVFETDKETGISTPASYTDTDGTVKMRYWQYDQATADKALQEELLNTQEKHKRVIQRQAELKAQFSQPMPKYSGFNAQYLYRSY